MDRSRVLSSRFLFCDHEKRAALDAWGEKLQEIIAGKKSKIVRMIR
jgi:hypothetical protein